MDEAPSGRLIKMSMQISEAQLAAVDAFAERRFMSRATAIRQLVDLGLKAQQRIDRVTEAAAV